MKMPANRAKRIIQRLSHRGIRLIVDGSKVGFGHQLLLIAITYRSRSIPLAWTWVIRIGENMAERLIANGSKLIISFVFYP